MADNRLLGLKIDVDTRRGMEEGVPSLLDTLSWAGCRATFFLSFGPDNSGKAIWQLLRNPRFLWKMIRTNAPGLYGWRTALYGTLLPAPPIASAFPDLCREIKERGHEVELHAWDHRAWQDTLPRRNGSWIREWLNRGIDAYERCLRHPPSAFGAPGWVLTEEALSELGRFPFSYVSCTRAETPFVHAGSRLTEIPSDLPCLEETGGEKGIGSILDALRPAGIHVLPVHAEVEGGIFRDTFGRILRQVLASGVSVVPLSRIASAAGSRSLPERRFRTALLPGRAFPCAV